MTSTDAPRVSDSELHMGQEMSLITFGELVKELTGTAFEEIYNDYLIHGDSNAKSNLE